jgi:hypothetical protein
MLNVGLAWTPPFGACEARDSGEEGWMEVRDYSFGRIDVDGTVYTSDVIIYPGRVQEHWWRQQGHRLCMDDLADVLRNPPRVLVIGTGYLGVMRVPAATLEALRAAGIEPRVMKTREAVAELGRLQRESARVVAALHLTC